MVRISTLSFVCAFAALLAPFAANGSYTIRFGGCGNGVENCLPIVEVWNYAVRMYEPEQSIQDGSWTFPGPPTPRSK